MTNVTYVSALDFAIETINTYIVEPADSVKYIEKLEALKVQLAKRNSGERKPTAHQKENEQVKELILQNLEGSRMRAGDIATLLGLTIQRVTALLTAMVKSGDVEKVVEKKVTYFQLPSEEAEEEVAE